MTFETYQHEGIEISTDPDRLDVQAIHVFLLTAYWCENIPIEVVQASIRHSLCFGMFDGGSQIGFARVITDRATFAYLGDVYVLPSHRGRGLSKWMMECVMKHPELQGLRRFMLATQDAHGLYRQAGFKPMSRPDWFMEVVNPDVYKTAESIDSKA